MDRRTDSGGRTDSGRMNNGRTEDQKAQCLYHLSFAA